MNTLYLYTKKTEISVLFKNIKKEIIHEKLRA